MMGQNHHLSPLVGQAGRAAALLGAMSNANRLLALCHLAEAGEMHVGQLAQAVGLSQSALSQHLAKLRTDGLVTTRKNAQTVYYRLADEKVLPLLLLLRDQFCPELRNEKRVEE